MEEWQKVVVPKYVEQRPEPRALIEVCVESGSGTTVAGQHVPCTIKKDENGKFIRDEVVRDKDGGYLRGGDFVHQPIKVLVYKDELEKIGESVRQEHHWAELYAARRHFEIYMRDKTKGMPTAAVERAYAREGRSPESMLAERGFRKGIPPIVSVKVLNDNVPPPDIQASREQRREDRTTEILDAIRALLESRSVQQGNRGDQRDKR